MAILEYKNNLTKMKYCWERKKTTGEIFEDYMKWGSLPNRFEFKREEERT